ncbi:MAG TPA: nitroreductase family protein [Candidatus Bathyarchaeia archaeon]|nr:nitroreductase family protein [Candidatus Bathyarchaeia archaeon]
MDLFRAIKERRSIRRFKQEPLPTKDLMKILEAARLAPSGGNRQPWYFIIVRDLETKKNLSNAARNQKFIADADTVVIAIGDPLTSAAKLPYTLSSTRIPFRQEPMIAVEHMVLAATALGYGTCWIGAFNEDEVKRILKIPENLAVIALLPIGVADEAPQARQRKTFTEIFFKESYGTPMET